MYVTTDLPPALRRLLETITADEHRVAIDAVDDEVELGRGEHAVRRLADGLYRKWHAGSRRSLGDGVAPRDLADDDFMLPLAAELVDRRTASAGWVVQRAEPDALIVERDGIRVLAPRDRVSGELVEGRRVTVSLAAARPALSPGFFVVDGKRGTPAIEDSWTLRLYVHLDADGGVEAARRVLAALDAADVRFRMKVLAARVGYPRYDGLVAYLEEDAPAALLEGVAEAVGDLVAGGDVSPFVATMRDGVGFAWEPAERVWPPQSFGQHRCRLVAQAVVEWAVAAAGARSDLAGVVSDHFTVAGVDPTAPWREFASPPDPWEATM